MSKPVGSATAYVGVRLPAPLYAQIREMAQQGLRSLSKEVELAVRRHVEATNHPSTHSHA
jgi:hypothetical protein